MTRRTTGGSVRHHATRNLWEARYVGADGRRHSLYAGTEREAQARLRTALLAADHGIRPIGNQLTVSAFLDDWLTTSVHQRCRTRTADSYASTVRLYIEPAIGRISLAKLQPEHVGRMLADLSARGTLSPTTVRYAYSVTRTALGYALRQGKVLRNVATLVDPPPRAETNVQPLTRDQARALLVGVRGNPREALYVAALATGLRQGELLALRWSDIDLVRGELTVRHTLGRFSRQPEPTKTPRSRRTLRLPQQAIAALTAHRERQTVVPMSGLVFATDAGAPLQQVNVTLSLQRSSTP
ncbi:MAG: tyrosine-type recombinase/integrase [Chloroflexi bacterium]|nr:tyrosine-type recombinase/integrase [Chloroflexota bacterium]